jgi:hypothetical protein
MGARGTKKKTTARAKGKATPDNHNGTILLIIGIVAGVAIMGGLLYLALRPAQAIAGVVQFPRPSRGHEVNLEIPFGELPPVGGNHDPAWQNCGIYDEPLNTPNAVHSLEHGAIWITYQPDLPAEQIAAIEDAVSGQNFLLVSPYPEQRSPIVLTGWGVQLELDSLDDDRFDAFIEAYRVGPNTPERGASCTGGIGEPIG